MSESNRFSDFLIEKNSFLKKLIKDTITIGEIDENSARSCNENALRFFEDKNELSSKDFSNKSFKDRLKQSKEIAEKVVGCIDSKILPGNRQDTVNEMTKKTYKTVFGV
jgi:hypothetical protein